MKKIGLLFLILLIAVASNGSFVFAETDQVNVTLTVTNPGTPPGEDEEEDPAPEAPPPSVVNPFLSSLPGEISIEDPAIGETQTFAVFLGKTSPISKVVLLKDGTIIQRVTADALGEYKIIVPNLSPGSYVWAIKATDSFGFETRLITFSRELGRDVTTVLSDIILPPTIFRTGINTGYQFIGTAVPESKIILSFLQPETGNEYPEIIGSSGKDGGWNIMVQENQLPSEITLQARAAVVIGEERSVWSDGVAVEKKEKISDTVDVDEEGTILDFDTYMTGIGEMEQAVAIAPSFFEARIAIARAYEKIGDYGKGISILQEGAFVRGAISLPAYHYEIGRMYYNKALSENAAEESDLNIALASVEEALKLSPEYANARYTRALIYEQQGRIDDALADVRAVAEVNTGNEGLQAVLDRLEGKNAPDPEPIDEETGLEGEEDEDGKVKGEKVEEDEE